MSSSLFPLIVLHSSVYFILLTFESAYFISLRLYSSSLVLPNDLSFFSYLAVLLFLQFPLWFPLINFYSFGLAVFHLVFLSIAPCFLSGRRCGFLLHFSLKYQIKDTSCLDHFVITTCSRFVEKAYFFHLIFT